MSNAVRSFADLLKPLEGETRETARIQTLSKSEAGLRQLRAEARAEGFSEGLREGHAEGVNQGRLEVIQQMEDDRAQAARNLSQLLMELDDRASRALADWLAEAEPKLAELSVLIAGRILDAELNSSPDQILNLTKAALREIGSSTRAKIRVCPQDEGLISESARELIQGHAMLNEVEVVATNGGPRGVLIETEGGLVDGTIDHQLGAILGALRGEA